MWRALACGEAGSGLGALGRPPVPMHLQPTGVWAELGVIHAPAPRLWAAPGRLTPQRDHSLEGLAPPGGPVQEIKMLKDFFLFHRFKMLKDFFLFHRFTANSHGICPSHPFWTRLHTYYQFQYTTSIVKTNGLQINYACHQALWTDFLIFLSLGMGIVAYVM